MGPITQLDRLLLLFPSDLLSRYSCCTGHPCYSCCTGHPVIPVAPVTPVIPVAPVTPVIPVAPVTPVIPVAPVTPVVPYSCRTGHSCCSCWNMNWEEPKVGPIFSGPIMPLFNHNLSFCFN